MSNSLVLRPAKSPKETEASETKNEDVSHRQNADSTKTDPPNTYEEARAMSSQAQVIAITELREMILWYLPGCSFLVHRRTCKAFNEYFTNCPDIDNKLFLKPSASIPKLRGKRPSNFRVNDVVFRQISPTVLPGLSPKSANRSFMQYEFRIKNFTPSLLRVILSPTDARPLIIINLSSAALVAEAKNSLKTPWSKMFLSDPALPTRLRIYTEPDSAFWQFATVESKPATMRQLLQIALVVQEGAGFAAYAGREPDVWTAPGYHGVCHRYKWTRGAHETISRDYGPPWWESQHLMMSRPMYIEQEDLHLLNALGYLGLSDSG